MKTERSAEISRKTKETDIFVSLNIDGTGKHEIDTGIGFFDHMLTALAVHGGLDLTVRCKGDLQVDFHHTVEDVGIALGKSFKQALGQMRITRFGSAFIPMDDALAFCVLDIGGRAFLVYNVEFSSEKTGEFDNCLAKEFMQAFAFNSEITLHIGALYGNNDHHKLEAVFKALAYALRQAVKLNESEQIMSTKGVI